MISYDVNGSIHRTFSNIELQHVSKELGKKKWASKLMQNQMRSLLDAEMSK